MLALKQRFLFSCCIIFVQALGKYLKRNMSSASGRKLRQSTYDAVVKLCEDKDNTVFIVSGLNDKGLMHVRQSKKDRIG